MKYRLSRAGTDVEHGPVAVFDLAIARNLRGYEVQLAAGELAVAQSVRSLFGC